MILRLIIAALVLSLVVMAGVGLNMARHSHQCDDGDVTGPKSRYYVPSHRWAAAR